MKILALLGALALMGLSAAAQVATVQLNNWEPDRPIYHDGQLAGGGNVWVELLGGPTANDLIPVADTSTGVKKFAVDQGHFDVGYGVVPGVTPGGTGVFQLRVWESFVSWGNVEHWDFASALMKTVTAPWMQKTGSWDNTAQPQPPPDGPKLLIPNYIVLAIPEPSTAALGLLGTAALMLRRRQ